MRKGSLGACAAALCAAVAAGLLAPAHSEMDPWSEEAVKARFKDPDLEFKDKPDLFANNSECKDCHEDRLKSLASSFHEKLVSAKKSGTHGCQECHGPAQAHVDDDEVPLRNPSWTADLVAVSPPAVAPPKEGEAPRKHLTVPVAEMNAVCLRCHVEVLTKPVLDHREWLGRTRDPSGARSCVSCHSVHLDKSKPAYDKTVGPFTTIAESAVKAEYADPKLCIACHTEFHPQMARSGHADLMKDGADLHACGACHGAGSLHVQSGGDPLKIVNPLRQTPAQVNATCNACHVKGRATEKWTCAEHSREGLSCIDCHDANAAKGRTLRVRPTDEESRRPAAERAPPVTEFKLCGQCHLDVQAKFRIPNRHRVAEGRMECSDCHDPHGNTDKIRDREVSVRACAACHADKTGPFMYDHGIKRTEGCVACHDPHGSSNRRMLTYARIKPMCLQCHPETPHDLRSRTYDNCITCHTEIHGSNLNRKFLK